MLGMGNVEWNVIKVRAIEFSSENGLRYSITSAFPDAPAPLSVSEKCVVRYHKIYAYRKVNVKLGSEWFECKAVAYIASLFLYEV